MRALLACLPCVGCVLSVRPLTDNFSDATPGEALSMSIQRLEQIYSFTDWKDLDWDSIQASLEAEAASAESDEDWDRVFRKLAQSMPDGHVSIWNTDPALDLCPEARASLGVTFALLADGTPVVTTVRSDGPADRAGVTVGDVLAVYDGMPPDGALDAAPLHCSPVGLATHERRARVQARLLGRAPVGAVVSLQLQGDDRYAVELTAEHDGATVREALGMPLPEARVTHQMWTDGVGYIQVGWEETLLSERLFQRAVADLWGEGARSLVIDLRNNDGGTDQTAANIVGTFYEEETFYETITMYDRRTEGQVVISDVYVEPQPLRWDLPAAVLVNDNTVSSGEGMAMMLYRLDNVEIIGFEGTAASFGSAGSLIQLPGGWELSYPAGRSLDASGQIQLDSDATLEGGVPPEHRVPWTTDNRIADANDPVGFLVDYAAARLQGGAR